MARTLRKGTPATRAYVRFRRIRRRLVRSRRARIAAAAGAIGAAAFAVGVWVVVPLVVGKSLAAWAADAPGRAAAARSIAVNPFTLTVTLHDAELGTAAASAAARRVALDFGLAALFGRDVALDGIDVDGGRFEWFDGGGAPLVLDGVTARIANVSTRSPARFDIDVRDALGGALRIEGEAVLADTVDVRGRATLENVAAGPVAVRLFGAPAVAGAASGVADFDWDREDGTLHVSARIDVMQASLRDASGSAWLEAERLVALDAEADLRQGESTVSVGTVALTAPRATVVLGADDDRALGTVVAALSAGRVGRIEIDRGSLLIVDAGLDDAELDGPRPSLEALDVSGALERAADGSIAAELAARIAEQGAATLQVRATVGDAPERDVTLELARVPASAFAEHMRALAGIRLAGGTVDARVRYRTDSDGVEGSARLGGHGLVVEPDDEPAVVEPDDESGPVGDGRERDVALALALLTDVAGSAETAFDFRAPRDPAADARLDRILAEAALIHLESVAAAPFAALGAAIGVEADVLEAVSFAPGVATPADPAVLDALAEVLLARPRIGLRVTGVAHRELDRDALAAQQIELHVTLATAGPTLVARPRPVDFASPRHRDVLDEFAGERLGAERLETIASYFTRTPDGRIVEEEMNDYYRAIFDALVENETIPENGIERLGRFRARSIADALMAKGVAESRIEIAPARVDSGEASAAAERGRHVDVPLEVFVVAEG